MNILELELINDFAQKDIEGFVAEGEKLYAQRLENAANAIISSKKRIVLLSGPSGSGKTTSALRIGRILEKNGFHTNVISMDNYFLPIGADVPLGEDGRPDLESPYRMDIDLLNMQMEQILMGASPSIPSFDFKTQSRLAGTPLKRYPDDIVIFEGIHSLNPEVTGNDDTKMGIYASVRTRLKKSDGTLLHPRLIRVLRRLCRDSLFRGRDYRETFEMLESVTRGEEKYIMPYKPRATFDLDTFIPYEIAAYRALLGNGISLLSKDIPKNQNCSLSAGFLEETQPLDLSAVPKNSLIREFIGGIEL